MNHLSELRELIDILEERVPDSFHAQVMFEALAAVSDFMWENESEGFETQWQDIAGILTQVLGDGMR